MLQSNKPLYITLLHINCMRLSAECMHQMLLFWIPLLPMNFAEFCCQTRGLSVSTYSSGWLVQIFKLFCSWPKFYSIAWANLNKSVDLLSSEVSHPSPFIATGGDHCKQKLVCDDPLQSLSHSPSLLHRDWKRLEGIIMNHAILVYK